MNISYAHVVSGEVESTFRILPNTGHIMNEDGERVAVSNFSTLDPEVLAENGWYRLFDDGGTAHDPNTHNVTGPEYEIRDDHVVAIYGTVPCDPHLEIDEFVIEANDADIATATYYNAHDWAPDEVVFTVNGAQETVVVDNARAILQVTTVNPGPIDISVDALPNVTYTIQAEEV